MRWSFLREVGRKLIHLTVLFVLALYLVVQRTYGKQAALITVVGILVIFLVLEYVRLELGIVHVFFEKFIRPKEQHSMYGAIFFLSGVIISLAVFDVRIAFASILMATFGDLAASLMGRRFGEARIFRDKTVVGFISEFVVNLIVGFIVLSPEYAFYVTITMALVASVVETFVDELDDNFLVPVMSGFIGQILSQIF
jgi:diacylglycerol kinase (CTP)